MKKLTFILILFSVICNTNAQVFQVETLKYSGDPNKFINIVIMGDGFSASEQDIFITKATNYINNFFSESPWSNYVNYFNVYAIKVISAQSGVKHPGTATDVSEPIFPVSNIVSYFDTTFDYYGIHRLVVPQNTTKIVNTLATNFPNYDQVLILVNSTNYGGSGGSFATATIDSQSEEVMDHEIGHSFSNLADEYYGGDIFAFERANLTRQTNPLLVKWKNWIGINGIGINQHCCVGQSASWYRPHQSCKMRSLGFPFCSVCKQAIIESIHSRSNPIVSYTPTNTSVNSQNQFINFTLTQLMKPTPNTLNIQWKLDSALIGSNVETIQIDQNILTTGLHTLTAIVTDASNLLKVDNHESVHLNTVTWTINKQVLGLELFSNTNKVSYLGYPNPTLNKFYIDFELDKKSETSIQLISIDGKMIQNVEKETLQIGKHKKTIDLEKLAAGSYIVEFKIDNTIIKKQTIIKQ